MKAIQVMFKDKSNAVYKNVMEWNVTRQQDQTTGEIMDSLVIIYIDAIGANEIKHVEQLPFNDIIGLVYSNANENTNADAFIENEPEEDA